MTLAILPTMKKSHEVLKQAITESGAKAVAADMGLSQSLIYKWCQASAGPDSSGTDNPLDRLLEICQLTENEQPIDWLCEQTDSFRIHNPRLGESTDHSVLGNTQAILKEFSEMLEAVTESYANGQRIDEAESSRIRKEWEDLKRVAEQFVHACEKGVFDQKGDRHV